MCDTRHDSILSTHTGQRHGYPHGLDQDVRHFLYRHVTVTVSSNARSVYMNLHAYNQDQMYCYNTLVVCMVMCVFFAVSVCSTHYFRGFQYKT